MLLMISLVVIILTLVGVSGSCASPQKSIFLSLRSLASRQHLQRLFESMSEATSSYSLSYKDQGSNKSYEISELQYRLRYNNHYQVESFVDQRTVRVRLGRIDLFAVINYSIKDKKNKTQFQGQEYAIATLDPSYFQKKLLQNADFVYWGAQSTGLLTFTGLWNLENNFYLPGSERYVLQKMLNYILPTLNVRPLIQNQINTLFKSQLNSFLNSDHLFSISQIPYQFKGISLPLTHKVSTISVDKSSQGVIALIDFGVSDASQTNCSGIPGEFSEGVFGGVQQLISMSTISFIVQQAIKRGLFDISLDRSWETQLFQLYMGDLANAVAAADEYDSVSPIVVTCKPVNYSKLASSQFDERRIYIEIPETCLIQYKGESILKVDLFLILLVKLSAQKDYLAVKTDRVYSKRVKYESLSSNFTVTDAEVAQMIQNSLLESLVGLSAFGTSLPLIEKKRAALILMPEYMIVFDSSQVLPPAKAA